jgi:ribosome recycling factor
MAADEILLEVEGNMESAVDYFRSELRGIRTGRASGGLVEHIKVEYYGSPTDLRQLAGISTPDASMIIIKPFDASCIKDIERAIQASNIGITPAVDGKVIRLSVPALSMERRQQLISQVRKMSEASKVSIRNARRDGNKEADKQQKDSEMTEDDAKKCKDDIQDLTKKYEGKIDEILAAKVAEIEEN